MQSARFNILAVLASTSLQFLESFAVGTAGGVGIPEKFDVAAQRDPGEFPAGALAVVEPDDLPAKTDGKRLNPDAAKASDKEMPKFVNKYDQSNYEKKSWKAYAQPGEEIGDESRHTDSYSLISKGNVNW